MKRLISNKEKRRHLGMSRIIFLIVLLVSNTFAWFIYATKIDSDISVHVRAWNVVFEAGENQITDTINLTVDSVYPGMEDFKYEVKAYNRSDVAASLSYQILSARILDQEYISIDEREILGQEPQPGDVTSEELKAILANNFPFKITVETSSETIALGDGEETYTFGVLWPFESDDDELDTLWGVNAYKYKESNPDNPSITLNVKVIITQNPD